MLRSSNHWSPVIVPFIALGALAGAAACSDPADDPATNAVIPVPAQQPVTPAAVQPIANQPEQASPAAPAIPEPAVGSGTPAVPTPGSPATDPAVANPVLPPTVANPTTPPTDTGAGPPPAAIPVPSPVTPPTQPGEPPATTPPAMVPEPTAPPAAAGGPVEFTCGATEVATDNNLFFNGMSAASLGGWNHGNAVDPAFGGNAFSTDPGAKVQPDATCAGSSTWQATLVKKYHDWDQQHVNGMQFNGMQLSVNGFSKLLVELRFDPASTKVPTPDAVLAHFEPFMSGAGVAWDSAAALALDNGNATLLLDLAEFDAGPETRVLKAKFKISVPPADFGKWLRFEVPASELDYFFFHNWVPEAVTHAEAVATGKTLTKGLLFAELESEGSIRAVVNSADDQKGQSGWAALNPRPTPLYAEHAVSVRKIGFAQ